MKSGESYLNKEKRIYNRMYILSHLEDIIKESIYYRNNSVDLKQSKSASLDINQDIIKEKLL